MKYAFCVLTLALLGGCAAGAPPTERSLADSIPRPDAPQTIRVSALTMGDTPTPVDFNVSVDPASNRAVVVPAHLGVANYVERRYEWTKRGSSATPDRVLYEDRAFYEDVLFRAMGRRCEITDSVPRPQGTGYEFLYRC